MGRPTKLTPEVQEAIVKAVSVGATLDAAAESAGITYRTFANWMERGKKATKGDYFQFFQEISMAAARVRVNMASTIAQAAAGGDAKAAIEWLKRRDPAQWGDRLQISRLSDDELLRLLAIAESGGLIGGSAAAGTDDAAGAEA